MVQAQAEYEYAVEHGAQNKTGEPDGSTQTDGINAWFAVRIGKRQMVEAVEKRVNTNLL